MRLLLFVVYSIATYAGFKVFGYIFNAPIPSSVLVLYMFFAVITILLVMTSTEEGAKGLLSPIDALANDPKKRRLKYIVTLIVPVVVFVLVYLSIGEEEAPVELRSTHPAPPATFNAYGSAFDMEGLKNPLRRFEKDDPAIFKEMVNEGGNIYFRHCFYCHGAALDGGGHYASSIIDPRPLPFAGKDTIAQLRESYVFWRIVKGGAGLRDEGAPWASAMPAWEGVLTEDEVWKVILFMYDYTENIPRD